MQYHTLDQAIYAAFSIAMDRLDTINFSANVGMGDGGGVIAYTNTNAVQVTIGGAACDEEDTYYTIGSVITRFRVTGDDPLALTYFS